MRWLEPSAPRRSALSSMSTMAERSAELARGRFRRRCPCSVLQPGSHEACLRRHELPRHGDRRATRDRGYCGRRRATRSGLRVQTTGSHRPAVSGHRPGGDRCLRALPLRPAGHGRGFVVLDGDTGQVEGFDVACSFSPTRCSRSAPCRRPVTTMARARPTNRYRALSSSTSPPPWAGCASGTPTTRSPSSSPGNSDKGLHNVDFFIHLDEDWVAIVRALRKLGLDSTSP